MSDTEKLHLDPKLQVIQLDFDMDNRKKAERRTKYHHFCSLEALDAILTSRAIKFNNIGNYQGTDEYERKNVAPEFWGQVFVACLTTIPDSDDLWNDFGDSGRGVRIDFTFPSIFHADVFDAKRMVRSFGADGNEYEELGFSISCVTCPCLTCNPNHFTQPFVDILLTDIDYTDSPKSSSICIEGKKALDLSSASTEVPFRFLDEYETRVRGVLRSTHKMCMDKISYLLVPIKLRYMRVEFGKEVGNVDRQHYLEPLAELQRSEENATL